MAEDLKALQLAAQRNATAKRRLEGLDEKYDRASALRDSPMPTAGGRYGYTNALEGIATVMRRRRGEKQMARVEPRRDAVKSRIGFGEGMLDSNALALTMAREGRDVESAKQQATAASEATRAAQAEFDQLGDAKKYVTKDGDPITVVEDENGLPKWQRGDELVPLPEGAYEDALVSGGKHMSFTEQGAMADQLTNTHEASVIAGNFLDSYGQPAGVPTGIANRIFMRASTEDIMKYWNEDMDQNSKDALNWWAQWKMIYTLRERNMVFGATLTPREQREWELAENMHPGMDPVEIRKRVNGLTRILREKLINRANIGRHDRANQAFWKEGMGTYGDMISRDPKTGRYSDIFTTPESKAAEIAASPAQAAPMAEVPAAAPITSALPKSSVQVAPAPVALPPEEAAALSPEEQAHLDAMPPEKRAAILEEAGVTTKEGLGAPTAKPEVRPTKPALPVLPRARRTDAERQAMRDSPGTKYPEAIARVAALPKSTNAPPESKPDMRPRYEATNMVSSEAEQKKRTDAASSNRDLNSMSKEELRKRENWPNNIRELEALPIGKRVFFLDKYNKIRKDGTLEYNDETQ